jgi:hypothetical protein
VEGFKIFLQIYENREPCTSVSDPHSMGRLDPDPHFAIMPSYMYVYMTSCRIGTLFITAAEWEKLYQPDPLAQQIEAAWRAVEQRKQDRIQREQAITESLEKMEAQVKQWRARVNTRNRQAESERLRREQVSCVANGKPGFVLWIPD